MHQHANESLKMAELQKPTSLQRSHRDSISGSAELHALTPHLASHPACPSPYRRTAEIEFACASDKLVSYRIVDSCRY